MKNIRIHWTAALLLPGIMLISTALYGQSAIEKQAQALMEAQKYKACAKLLEKEVKKPNVPLSVLRIAMNANLRAGNPMTAALLATDLLQRSDKDDLDTLFEAAQAAELSGDDKLAVSRYHTYALKARDRKDVENRLYKALSYVLANGSFPDAFRIYAEREGTSLTWKKALDSLRALIDRNELKELYSMFRFIVETYRDTPGVVAEAVNILAGHSNSLRKTDIPHLLDVLATCRYPAGDFNPNQLYGFIARLYTNGGLDAHAAFRCGRRFVEQSGLTPSDSRVFTAPADKYLKTARKNKTVGQTASEIIGVSKYYLKGKNQDALQQYLQLILDNPDVFRSRFNPKELGRLVDRLSMLQETKYYDSRSAYIFNRFVSKFYKDDKYTEKAIEFALEALPHATPEMAGWLFDIDPENARSGRKDSWIDRYLEAKHLSPFEQKLREMQIIGSLAESRSTARFASALRNIILSTDYDPGYLLGMIRASKISGAALAKALGGALEEQGPTVKMKAMLDSLLASEYKGDARLQTLKSQSDRKSGSMFFSAAARVFAAKDADKIEKAVGNFLAAAKGVNVPSIPAQAANLHEYTVYQVLQRNKKLWENEGSAKLIVQRFLPKMNIPGRGMDELLSRAWSLDGANRKGGLFYHSLKKVLPAYNAHPGAVIPNQYNIISNNIQPEGKDTNIFASSYKRITSLAISYMLKAVDSWSKDYFFRQIESVMESPDAEMPENELGRLRNVFESSSFKYRKQIPLSTLAAGLKKIVRTGNISKKIDLNLEISWMRLAEEKQREKLLLVYAAALRSRSGREQMAAFNEVYRHLIYDNNPASGIAFADAALKPLLGQWPVKDWHQVLINSNMFGFFFSVSASKDKKIDSALKVSAGVYCRALRNAFLTGNAFFVDDYNMGRYAEALLPGLESIAKSGNLTAIDRAAVMIGFALDKETSTWRGTQVAEKAMKALEKTPPQLQYVFLNCFATGNSAFNTAMRQKFALTMAKLAKSIPGLVPVDKSDAAYNLFVAQQMKREGNALQAWALVRGKFPVLVQRWKEFDLDFVLWVVNQARKSKMFKEALELAQTMWMDEAKLSAADAARLGLSKGDMYRDWKNYPAARIEYESLTRNKRYAKTEAGRMAKFRLIELLILTQDYGTARTMLERLQEARNLNDQAEAFYLTARIDYENQDYESAMEHLAETFQRKYSHEEGRLLQGEIMLKTNKITQLELELGMKELATIAIPGKPINLMIQDMNLSVIRGGKTLPVIVSTTVGKDSEAVELMPSPQDPTKFTASLPTALGKAVRNNMILELNGRDRIQYRIDPKFQQENGIARPPNELELRYPAKLYASSLPILSGEHQEELKLLESLELTSGTSSRASIASVVRPGSPIHVRVVDFDMSLRPDRPDSVFVDISCSSGDELKHYELKETGNSTGVFEAKVPTGVPFPNVNVSDSIEGIDLNAVINSTKKGSWKSLGDGVCPKWIEIDTMTSGNFIEGSIFMPNPATVKSLKVYGILGKEEDQLAAFPAADKDKKPGGLRVRVRTGIQPGLRQLENLFRGSTEEGIALRRPDFNRGLSPEHRGKTMALSYEMHGAFYLSGNKEIEFKFIQRPDNNQRAFLMIDGKLLLGGIMNASGIMTTRRIFLQKGVHILRVYATGSSRDAAVRVGMLQPDGSTSTLPSDWFSVEKNPALGEFLKPKGTITQTPSGFRIALTKPLRYRKLKWVFDDFSGSQVEVTGATIVNEKGRRIIPSDQDLSSGKGNQILEIAAADTITVKYEDEKRIDDNKAVLTEKLSSSFYDANIRFCYEDIQMDEEGRTRRSYEQAARVTQGDDVIVRVFDPDEDRSDERETVRVEITTSSGEKLPLELMEGGGETGGARGNFMETFRVGDKTDPARRTLRVMPGDTITARYLDKENNSPGIPFVRTARLANNEGARPQLIVFDTKINLVEDRSPAALARIQTLKNKGDKRAGIKIYKEHITAKPIQERTARPKKPGSAAKEEVLTVNSKTPLLLELVCPELAKHQGSKAYVDVLTGTEIAAAESERREPIPLRVELSLNSLSVCARSKGYQITVDGREASSAEHILDQGVFAGIVRFQLGSPNDEINDLVATNEAFNLLNEDNARMDSDAFKVPTVIVSGSDRVYISFKDKDGKEILKKSLRLRSDGELGLYDKAYLTPNSSVHLGQHFHVRVYDPDRDITADRDTVDVDVSGTTGDKMKLKLTETLPHSGIFTSSLKVELKPQKPLEGQTEIRKLDNATLWSKFGDKVQFSYTDLIPLHSVTAQTVSATGEVVIGSDGELAAFTKQFKDPDMAVKTNFLMAEALFEMAKSHKAILGPDNKPDPEKKAQAKQEIARGKRVLEEALRDYPDTTLKAQGDFLLANLSLQLEDYTSALSQFSSVISKYPDSEYAPRSYFQKAVCYEKLAALDKNPQRRLQKGDLACEEFVRLTYLYPNSSFATDAKLRLGNYYYKTKRYRLAASVLEKFGEAYPENPYAPKALLLAGYAARRNEELKVKQAAELKRRYKPDYTAAIRIFSLLDNRYEDNKTERPQAMYWAGDSLYSTGTHEGRVKAYQFFTRLIWAYPESKWAKIARGRMAANPI